MLRNLAVLPTFVKVAKSLSFSKAAKELFLSPGAVSVQIKQLEEELGFKLFERKTRQIFLTRKGERFLGTVDPALTQIFAQVEAIRYMDQSDRLSVSTLPSFATKWLIPKLALFHQKHPALSIRIHTSENLIDFIAEQIDCSIRYGNGLYPGLDVTLLMEDWFYPVCHPKLVKENLPLKDFSEIAAYTLLHDVVVSAGSNISWLSWAKEVGVDHLDFNRGLLYNQADYAVQAAVSGQGVALARSSLVEDDIAAGHLVPLFDHKIKSSFCYYFVHPREFADNKGLKLFKEWIQEEMRS